MDIVWILGGYWVETVWRLGRLGGGARLQSAMAIIILRPRDPIRTEIWFIGIEALALALLAVGQLVEHARDHRGRDGEHSAEQPAADSIGYVPAQSHNHTGVWMGSAIINWCWRRRGHGRTDGQVDDGSRSKLGT